MVRDAPGFASSRLGIVLGMEAIRMVEQGVASPEDIDKAMVLGYRHPMGPLKLTDLVGLDVRLAITRGLHQRLGEVFRPPALLEQMVAEGKLGRKSGEGFYRWEKGKPKKDNAKASGHDLDALAKRLMEPYFEECRASLGDQVVEDADVLDAGMVFGTGFAPFRGGPLNYLRALSAAESGQGGNGNE